jgi:hypothetical protein
MAMLPDVFNAKEEEKMGSFEPIPAGWYMASITKSELKNNKAGTGQYLALQFKIIDGEFAKRLAFTNLNLVHSNSQTVEIARKELASICEAAGIEELEDSSELHGIPMGIRLIIKPGDANWPAKNEIKGYRSEEEQEAKASDEDDSPF